MPQVSYLVREQVTARLSNQESGFNFWLAQACRDELPSPNPYIILWGLPSTNFWTSYVSAEDLDKTSDPDDGTICMVYTARIENMTGTVVKYALFSGVVEIGVEFDIAWDQEDAPSDTESLADATDDAMVQTFNAPAYYGSFSGGVLWNGQVSCERAPLRQSGPGWRQRLAYRLSFEVQV